MSESGYFAYLHSEGKWKWVAFVGGGERTGFEDSRDRAVSVAVRVLGELKGEAA
jgi:hypothetical protein